MIFLLERRNLVGAQRVITQIVWVYIPTKRIPIEGGMSKLPKFREWASTLRTPKHQIHDDSMGCHFPLVHVASCSTNVGKCTYLANG